MKYKTLIEALCIKDVTYGNQVIFTADRYYHVIRTESNGKDTDLIIKDDNGNQASIILCSKYQLEHFIIRLNRLVEVSDPENWGNHKTVWHSMFTLFNNTILRITFEPSLLSDYELYLNFHVDEDKIKECWDKCRKTYDSVNEPISKEKLLKLGYKEW